METDKVGSEADVEQGSVRRELTRMVLLVTMGGDEISAFGRAIESDFALGAAANSADFFGLGRTEARGLAFLTDWTEHEVPWSGA